jgi:hypothetical protein
MGSPHQDAWIGSAKDMTAGRASNAYPSAMASHTLTSTSVVDCQANVPSASA